MKKKEIEFEKCKNFIGFLIIQLKVIKTLITILITFY